MAGEDSQMSRTGIVPIIKLINERIEDLRMAPFETGSRKEAYYALCKARNFLIIARTELQKADVEDAEPIFKRAGE
jgi:hypothetical protein